jgi:hypothetical protein
MKVIRCHSKKCKGRIIGKVPDKGQPISILNDDKTSGLLSVRLRMDKNFGFQCFCGNNSLLSVHEAEAVKKSGNLRNGMPPSRAEVKEIWRRVNDNPTITKNKDGRLMIENFSIEEIK